jgi:TonB family protein
VKKAFIPVRSPLLVKVSFQLFLLLVTAILSPAAFGQGGSDAPTPDPTATVQARIERARALAAAHQLSAAATELESLRSTTRDDMIRNVTSVMLMSICLEEGNYARAASLLEETFAARKVRKEESIRTYFALAGQAVNGARAHVARYRNFGINVGDPLLPAEALNDLERLRSLMERMTVQAKEITRDQPRAYESLALLEDILSIRLSLARNDEDREKWEMERAGVRLGLTSSQTQIASLNTTSPGQPPVENKGVPGGITPTVAKAPAPAPASATPTQTPVSTDGEPVNTGSLNLRATRRVVPVYPTIAKNAAAQGIVRVYVTVDENGNVSGVFRSEGPPLLKGAAEDAARRWKFSPSEVDGKPVRLIGYIEFTFTL